MNLAYRDIKHNLLRFLLTNFGLSLLLGIVIMITAVYGGLIDDALRQVRAAHADLWVVEASTLGPFAESSRIPGDTRELVSRVYGVERAGARHLPVDPGHCERPAEPRCSWSAMSWGGRAAHPGSRPGAASCAAIMRWWSTAAPG